MKEFTAIEEAQQAGWLRREDLTGHQWLDPQLPPGARVGEVLLWPATAVELLKTRRGWKRLDRHVIKGAEPVRVVGEEEVRLFARSQTVSGEEHDSHRLEVILSHVQAWKEAWHQWAAALSQWENQQGREPGPQAESLLPDLLKTWHHLQARWDNLPKAVLTPAVVGDVVLHRWEQALAGYRERRFATVIEDLPASDLPLAREVDQALTTHELETGHGVARLPLMPYWAFYGRFAKELEAARLAREVSEATRIHHFHLLFPAREIPRRFTLYLGPTNSGKTYRALRRLAAAGHGIYLAPLRLLALEVAETLNQWGVPCHMITGEERILVPGARHTACTVEMLPLDRHFDFCVIDETQMLGDADRGWAWTQAILGVMADEVCLLGAPEARPVLESLLELTRDPYEVEILERLAPLHFLEKPVKRFEELEPGTAIVAFSRGAVLGLRDEIERHTGQRAAVLYGALPPEVRREQARLFASGEAPLLVATDAIGMGLNLPIRTLLFAQDHKVIDREEVSLTPMEVRQIAGRAGRFGKNEVGFVGVFRITANHVREIYHRDPPVIRRAHLAPNLDHLLAIADIQERTRHPSLARLMGLFLRTVKPDPRIYRLADLEDQMVLARITDRFKSLSLENRFHLSAAPVPLTAALAVAAFGEMVETVATRHARSLADFLPDDHGKPMRLEMLETAMRIVNLYSWLHYRFPDHFPDLESAAEQRRQINRAINQMLAQSRKQGRACSECQKPLPPEHRFGQCDDCWRKSRAQRHRNRWRGRGRMD